MRETRARSHWAWGYVDRLPDDDGRRALAAQIGWLLGVEPPSLSRLPSIDDVRLAPSRVVVPPELAQVASTGDRDRIEHTHGRAFPDLVRGFRGDFTGAPDAVVFPTSEGEVASALAWCAREGLAAVPYGGGTSVVGGVAAPQGTLHRGVVTIDLRAMHRVLEVDAVSRAARIEAGATGPMVERQLGEHGLTLRHYPQSFEFSTLGGWLATRAGGHFATLYTHIDDLVESVRMVTPRGVFATRRLPASGAGPAPDRLVLGSEGTLGVITEAWVRVQARPRWRSSASVFFATFAAGVEAVRAVAQAGLFPSNCRLLDPVEALLGGVDGSGEAVLLLGFESADHEPHARMQRALELALAHGGRCPRGVVLRDDGPGDARRGGDAATEAWRGAFFEGPYRQSALVSLGVVADTFETACTFADFAALDADMRASLAAAFDAIGARGVVACRFTHVYPDGPAPYYTFVCAPPPGDVLDAWATLKHAAGDALARRGATITHHHAVGRTHRPWYDRERPDLFAEALRAAKRALDPAGTLNPGVLFDP